MYRIIPKRHYKRIYNIHITVYSDLLPIAEFEVQAKAFSKSQARKIVKERLKLKTSKITLQKK